MIVCGFINGAIYTLVALGFSLCFGVSRVANFSYGALYVLGGVLTWSLMMKLGFPYILSVFLSLVIMGILGAAIYRLFLFRLRGMEFPEIIVTFAIGIVILETLRCVGIMGFQYRLPPFIAGSVDIFGTTVGVQRVIIVIASALLLIALYVFVHHTKLGLSLRGIAQDQYTALSVGININKASMVSFCLSSMLCMLSAVLILPLGTIMVDDGYSILVKVLAVCVVGGLESTLGVIVASFVISYVEIAISMYVSSSLTMIVPFACLLIILLIKPSGLFGKYKEIEERV